MPARSLHARIALRLCGVFGLVAAAFAAAAWYYARTTADEAYDALLASGAAEIAEDMYVQGGVLTVEPPVSVLASLSAHDRVFYKVVDPRGIVVAGASDLSAPGQLPPGWPQGRGGPALRDGTYHGVSVRMAVARRAVQDGWASVTVAQTRQARAALARDLTAKAVLGILVLSGLALAATIMAVNQALAPLGRVGREIRDRDPQDLRPLQVEAPPEIHALLAAINDFMARLDARIGLMRRLIGDAAHQIRTPLTALAAQLDLLGAEPAADRREQHVRRLQERTQQLGRLANQMFNHAMVVHRADVVPFGPVDLVEMARRVLLDAAPLDGAVELSLDAPDEPVPIQGDPVSLREALSNLVHNALRHGARSRVEVRILRDSGEIRVEVLDDGPGIPPALWARVREPFHGRGDDRGGAGLGLAIADEAVRAHRGELSFRSHSGEGFAVILSFRRLEREAARPSVPGA